MRTNTLFERLIAPHPVLQRRAKRISLMHGDMIGACGCVIHDIVFPQSGMISVVTELPNGDRVESAAIGFEGAVGLQALFGLRTYSCSNIAQLTGDGWRVKVADLAEALEADRSLRELAFRAYDRLLLQAQQSAACNAKHPVGQRLASWLLRAHYTSGEQDFAVTQEHIAEMLGVQRATLSGMAAALQEGDLISYRRGRLKIIDVAGLEAQSCGCHKAALEQHLNLVKEGTAIDVGRGADRVAAAQ